MQFPRRSKERRGFFTESVMNNLHLAQEAKLGSIVSPGEILNFDTGTNRFALVYPFSGQPKYEVWIADDCEVYEFDGFAKAMDFICDEMRLAAA
jgi:hypothetical protein